MFGQLAVDVSNIPSNHNVVVAVFCSIEIVLQVIGLDVVVAIDEHDEFATSNSKGLLS